MLDNTLFWSLLITGELVIIEQSLIFTCLKKKYNVFYLLGILGVITTILSLLTIFVFSSDSTFGDGSGRYLFSGVLYFIPGLFMFKGKFIQKLIVNLTSFTYSIGIMIIAIRLAYIFDAKYFYILSFVLMSLLNLILLPVVIKYMKNMFVPVLNDLPKRLSRMFLVTSTIAFLLIAMLNLAMKGDDAPLQKAIVAILLFLFICIIYLFIIHYNNEIKATERFKSLAIINKVTDMANNNKFIMDSEEVIKNNSSFSLAYIDLDEFKQINDNFGHNKGDEYLYGFAQIIANCENPKIKFYHLSGDEFALISLEDLETTKKIIESIKIKKINDIKFLGFSFGIASFPHDASELKTLVNVADSNMYKLKNSKKIKGKAY